MKQELSKKYIIISMKRIFKYYKATLCVTVLTFSIFALLLWCGATLLKLKIALPDYMISGLLIITMGLVLIQSMSNGILSIVADSEREKEKKALNCENKSSGQALGEAETKEAARA